MAEEAAVIREITRASVVFRSVIGTTVGIGSQGIVMDGTEAQKREWLPKFATGEAISSFGLTEPDAGSDAASLRTVAIRDGDTYRITGTKRYITNAPRATRLHADGPHRTGREGRGGISAFIVPADTPGISWASRTRRWARKAPHVYDVILDDVVVPAANIIGGVPGRGFKTAMKVLDRGRIHIAAVALGMCQRLIEMSLRYAMERKQFGQRIADFQLVQAMLADMQGRGACHRSADGIGRRKVRCWRAGQSGGAALKYLASEPSAASPTARCRSMAAPAISPNIRSSASIATSALLRLYEGTSQIQQTHHRPQMIRAAS
jgi:acyl-CoA dehydrogenase